MTRFTIVATMLLGTSAFVVMHTPVNLAVGRGALQGCPVTFGEWNGTELSFDDAVEEELQADDILIRRYERGQEVAWLCIVYHQNRRYGAHDPRVCYVSQGYLIENESVARIEDGTPTGLMVNRFTADRRRDRRLVYYWWATEGLATHDPSAFRRRMALQGVLGNRSWGAFVRVEAKVRGDDDEATWRALDDFAARVATELPGVLARVGARKVEPS